MQIVREGHTQNIGSQKLIKTRPRWQNLTGSNSQMDNFTAQICHFDSPLLQSWLLWRGRDLEKKGIHRTHRDQHTLFSKRNTTSILYVLAFMLQWPFWFCQTIFRVTVFLCQTSVQFPKSCVSFEEECNRMKPVDFDLKLNMHGIRTFLPTYQKRSKFCAL